MTAYYRELDTLTDHQLRDFCDWCWEQARKRDLVALVLWRALQA